MIKGADISSLPELEDKGAAFFLAGRKAGLLEILQQNSIDYIRLRIWNEPKDGYCGKEKTIAFAKRIKEMGFRFLLDFHYSDWWADPGKQNKPKAWEHLSLVELEKALYAFTREVIEDLKKENAMPDMVQIGNEITYGMLWDTGKTGEEFDTKIQWDQLCLLVKAGIRAVQEVDPTIKIMIHTDRGGDHQGTVRFVEEIKARAVKYDVLGLSYYPSFHGEMSGLEENLSKLKELYEEEICVVEVAYPFTTDPKPYLEDPFVTEEQLHSGFPATPEGQRDYFKALLECLKKYDCQGFFYWEPAWIPAGSPEEKAKNAWATMAIFDYHGNALPALDVIKEFL